MDAIKAAALGYPFETGGILGSRGKKLVDEVVIDLQGASCESPCSYAPNVDFLNRSIEDWQRRGIRFVGIYHTHFGGAKQLSCGDRRYINAIMAAMPQQIERLYFPIIVLPSAEPICYTAIRSNEALDIRVEEVVIE